ncbi:MAG: M48 family metallopeptidase [Proteobacteria bacterium]|nr:M48 family metallopeptidase [Pseudomonadota bacterium]HQR03701.1 M48 family metallopeptidase [Rhodocyclaceae bacterium]
MHRLLAPFVLAAVLAACTANPISGRQQLMLVSEDSAISESLQEYRQMVGQYRKQGKLSTDSRLIARVHRITDRLIDQAVQYRPETADWTWRVEVIDDPKTVNAWCMPGGKMAVYTGLIEKIQPSDDELAQVMAHEISHALLKHGAEKMSMSMVAGGVVAAAAISDRDGGNYAPLAQMVALGAILLPNSREAESEADRVGLGLAARAGFNPHAAVTLWDKMVRESGDNSRFDWLSTHPAGVRRMEALAAMEQDELPFYEAAPRLKSARRAWTTISPAASRAVSE